MVIIMGKQIELSERLQAVADMVTEGATVCDVGCDHGFVSIYLVESGISPKAIAMDVNKGPLQAAKEHIAGHGLADRIEARLSDGVEALQKGEADTLICAGMGGRLMKRILEEGRDKIGLMKELILQPQSELREMREYLRSRGYLIADENMILEEGKYYPMMKVLPAGQQGRRAYGPQSNECGAGRQILADEKDARRIEDKYGPILLQKKHPVLKAYLQKEERICRQILESLRDGGNGQEDRRREILERIRDMEVALSLYQTRMEC